MINDPRGSIWRKWDFHFHTYSSFDVSNEISNEEIIELLMSKEISAVVITDHHVIDVKRIQNLHKLSKGQLTIFPGIEFRSELGGSESVHFIGMFPEIGSGIDLERIWNSLDVKLEITQKLNSHGDDGIYIDFKEGASLIHDLGGLVSVHVGGKSNSIENIRNTKEYKKELKKDLVKDYVDIFEAGNIQDVEDYKKIVFPAIGHELPVIVASDTHHRADDPIRESCWIRADTTFTGLKRILRETGRVFVGESPLLIERVRNNPTKFIERIEIHKKEEVEFNEKWFDCELDINFGLSAIIGNKGGGKSALSDILGLLGNTYNAEDFSFLNTKKYKHSRNNKAQYFNAKLTWASGECDERSLSDPIDLGEVEKVKYIPQNYLEKVCNEIVIGKGGSFDSELKSVIFSHVLVDDRLGFDSLDGLLDFKTEEKEARIKMLRNTLHDVNETIIKLEAYLHPSYKQKLDSQLHLQRVMLNKHDELKPESMSNPEEGKSEQSIQLQEKLSKTSHDLKELSGQFHEVKDLKTEETRKLALSLKLLEKLKNFQLMYKEFKTGLEEFQELAIILDDLANLSINFQIVEDYRDEIEELLVQYDVLLDPDTEGSICYSYNELKKENESLQRSLDIPNQKYQSYLKSVENWEKKRKEIFGDSGEKGSIKYLESKINEISECPEQLEINKKKQADIVKQIFEQLSDLAESYRTLYKPVESFINQHNLAPNLELEFEVKIVPVDFETLFFEMINQGKRGTFCGSEEGRNFLRTLMVNFELNTSEGVLDFLRKLSESLMFDLREDPPVPNEIEDQFKKGFYQIDLIDFLFGLSYLSPKYSLKWAGKELSLLSPGERGTLLLIFYLLIDQDSTPLIIDQPEENLDNETVFRLLVPCIKEVEKRRQIIIVTHNPNLAVVCDADQIIYAAIDKTDGNKVMYNSGAIENPEINEHIVNVLEGTRPAFDNRDNKYKLVKI
ncbi:MAG: AAA family ATPase [Candidatus Aminicenantes bacterium]|nr:AAA family ATPase [Candidatus Aminicenantes bacterium]